MADKLVSVRVTGIREMSRALKQIGDEYPRLMTARLFAIGSKLAGQIASKVPRKDGSAAGTVKPQATSRGVAIVAGGGKAPYFQWLDFGGTVGRGHKRGYNMGAIHRAWLGKPGGSGRYVYPTISAARPETIDALDDALREVATSAGFDTAGHL